VEGALAAFAEDVYFEINGRGTGMPTLASPVQGKAALRPVMQQLVENFRFSDWRMISLLVDGEQAMHHWRALVTITPTGKAAKFDVFDVVTFRDGKYAEFRPSTDTAMIMSMTES
jgi:ketosteroid isomerase-like protein